MNNINILIEKATREVHLSKSVIGNDGENLQENLVFSFDEFVDGTARVELLKSNEEKSYIMLEKVDETYQLPIKSVLTKSGRLNLQLVITQGSDDEEIPIFKSNKFYLVINSSINAEIEEEEEYPQWIDVANTKLNEIDETLDDLQEKVDSGYFKGDKGDTGERGPQGPQGERGPKGNKGDTGEQGIQGEKGEQGIQGEKGEKGDTGSQGPQGIQGIQGPAGQNGANGQDGEDGFSPSASVNQSGNVTTISITDKAGTTTASIDLDNYATTQYVNNIIGDINEILESLTTPSGGE